MVVVYPFDHQHMYDQISYLSILDIFLVRERIPDLIPDASLETNGTVPSFEDTGPAGGIDGCFPLDFKTETELNPNAAWVEDEGITAFGGETNFLPEIGFKEGSIALSC